jgi:hypothetical protein
MIVLWSLYQGFEDGHGHQRNTKGPIWFGGDVFSFYCFTVKKGKIKNKLKREVKEDETENWRKGCMRQIHGQYSSYKMFS